MEELKHSMLSDSQLRWLKRMPENSIEQNGRILEFTEIAYHMSFQKALI